MRGRVLVSSRGTYRQLRRLTAMGRVTRLRRGLYAAPETASAAVDVLRVVSAVHRLDAVASHETAAALWGIPTLGRPDSLHVTRVRRCQGTARYDDVTIHHAALPPDQMTVHKGVQITTPARTVMDLARRREFRAGVVAADAALGMRACGRAELCAVAEACRGWPGVARARQVAQFADPRADSPLESISRVAFHDYGLPRPILQATIGGYERADFLWEAVRVIGEADGMGKYTRPEVLRREKIREENLVQMGFTVFRWTWHDAYRRPDALAHRALGILTRCGYRP